MKTDRKHLKTDKSRTETFVEQTNPGHARTDITFWGQTNEGQAQTDEGNMK